MKKRTVSIIRRLSENPDEKFTIESLAELFSVSQRTVRNDLNAINDALSDNGLDALELLSRGRIKIGDNFGELLPLVSEVDDQPTADLLTQRLDVHEKTAWMLRSLLED